ncbi:hypothetical protein DF268_32415 [Streptomyces sp. V2]|nr:hypothetical protein DF268_32415 [Streptomyces sp. V2]
MVTGGPSDGGEDGLALASSGGGVAAGDVLAAYLRAQATEFLRALRLHRETGAGAAPVDASLDAARALRRSARRISGSLHTFRPLLDPDWAEQIRPELAWLSGTLAQEHACEARLERLLLALHRLSGAPTLPEQPSPATRRAPGATASSRTPVTAPVGTPGTGHTDTALSATPSTTPGTAPSTPPSTKPGTKPPRPDTTPDRPALTVGAAKAGALLDRQLTLARTRAHSTALQALGSSRFHAVADKIALLASEVPLTPAARTTPLAQLAGAAEERLTAAIAGLPLLTAGHPYNAEALIHGLSPETAPHPQDTPWHQVRLLLRLHRYALEVVHGGAPQDVHLTGAGEALDRHRDASEAAAAAAQAARTPRIAPATAYALGVLHADQRHEVEAARYAFQQNWQARTLTPSS